MLFIKFQRALILPISSLLLLSAFSSVSVAGDLVYVMDGTAMYCPPKSEVPGTKAVQYSVEANQLIIRAVKCDSSNFVKDENLAVNRYVTADGVEVVENYKNFKLVVTAGNNPSSVIDLPNFENQSIAKVQIDDVRSTDGKVEAFLTSERVTNAFGITELEIVSWGSIRL